MVVEEGLDTPLARGQAKFMVFDGNMHVEMLFLMNASAHFIVFDVTQYSNFPQMNTFAFCICFIDNFLPWLNL